MPISQDKLARGAQHANACARLDVTGKQMPRECVGPITCDKKKQVSIVAWTARHRVSRMHVGLAWQGPAQLNRLPSQKTQPVRARCLQVQQAGIRCQCRNGAHLSQDELLGNVLRPARLEHFQRQIAAGCRVTAHQRVALSLLRFGERVVKVLCLHDVAGNDAHLAHAATAVAAPVVQFESCMQARLQQVGMPFHHELMPAGAHRDV
ncbi:MAG: hypothetical protein BWX79_01492 [Alphaproteobacteria bacterium ADurb.Bin100]|nr:MAG: hypothetical protein BWX79_01492 [Alphaproteobacteria bacterium ADurb.Bin100]